MRERTMYALDELTVSREAAFDVLELDLARMSPAPSVLLEDDPLQSGLSFEFF